MNYQEANTRLGNRDSRRMPGRSTYLVRLPNNVLAIRYYVTHVVKWFPCGRVQLDSVGYRTVTTKDRITTYSPVKVYQIVGRWMAGWGGRGLVVDFYDGMNWKNGRLLS